MVRLVLSEFVGTAFLLIAVVGSGIAAQRLSPADTGLALLENALATGGALFALIAVFGPVSGAHFNPVVTAAACALRQLPIRLLPPYVLAQVGGAAIGAMVANLMFGMAPVSISTTIRSSPSLWLAEVFATCGLVALVFGAARNRPSLVPFVVAAYITGAYFFMSSTSFANPAVTLGRMLSDSFSGIAPSSVAPFIAAQVLGAIAAFAFVRVLFPDPYRSDGE